MIFRISEEFCKSADCCDICDICAGIVANRHYIRAEHEAREIMDNAIKNHGGTRLRSLWSKYRSGNGFRPSSELSRALTTIDVDKDFPSEKLQYLATAKAHLFMENRNNEWPVFKRFASLYSRDPKIKNLAAHLYEAMNKGRISGEQCGGRDEIIPTYDSAAADAVATQGCQAEWFDMKSMILFDRDTDDDSTFCHHNRFLFKRLCDKDHTSVTNADIYTLSQQPPRWHMWYRRSIENYFDKQCYIDCNVDMSKAPDDASYHYFKIDKNSCKRYGKSSLPSLTDKISRIRLENGLITVNEHGSTLSEIQLFLLKLVKII